MAEAAEKTPLQVLKEARELLSDPARWMRGTWARNAAGHSVGPTDTSAICFCTRGAVYHIARCGIAQRAPGDSELWKTIRALGWSGSLAGWNDAPERTHAEVLDLFDRTIARLEAEAA